MAIQVLSAGSASSRDESFSYQVDYDSVSQTIGVTANGDGHGQLEVDVPSAGFSYGPVSLDPYVGQGRVPLPAGNPVTVPPASVPAPPAPHQTYPWTVTLTWQP